MKKFLLIYSSLVLLFSCAQKKPLTGGPKDETPPQIIQSIPSAEQTNFSGKQIILEFDEFIDASALKNKLIVCPTGSEKPEIDLKAQKVTLNFQQDFKPNTTYQIWFDGGIKDITELNEIEQKPFVFSTSNQIDSAFFTGRVIDAFTLEPQADVWILAYLKQTIDTASNLDSLISQKKADYIVKTDQQGHFSLTFLPQEALFKFFALKEEDRNFLFNPFIEHVAFNESFHSPKDSAEISLKLFSQAPKALWNIQTSKTDYGSTKVKCSDSTQTFQILNIPKSLYRITEDKKDTSRIVHLLDSILVDSIKKLIIQTDKHLDTVKNVSFSSKKMLMPQISNKETHLNPFEFFSISFNSPLKSIDTSKIILQKDSTVLTASFSLSSTQTSLNSTYKFLEDTLYKLELLPGALENYFAQTNEDTINYEFSLLSKSKFSTLQINIQDSLNSIENYPLIAQLFRQDQSLAQRQISTDKSFSFERVKGGQYTLKLIVDQNNDGKFTTGNVFTQLQPERVLLYEGKIEMQSGFDQEIIWKLQAIE